MALISEPTGKLFDERFYVTPVRLDILPCDVRDVLLISILFLVKHHASLQLIISVSEPLGSQEDTKL
jgi:hypothetical protein